jgi:hypothetical protein
MSKFAMAEGMTPFGTNEVTTEGFFDRRGGRFSPRRSPRRRRRRWCASGALTSAEFRSVIGRGRAPRTRCAWAKSNFLEFVRQLPAPPRRRGPAPWCARRRRALAKEGPHAVREVAVLLGAHPGSRRRRRGGPALLRRRRRGCRRSCSTSTSSTAAPLVRDSGGRLGARAAARAGRQGGSCVPGSGGFVAVDRQPGAGRTSGGRPSAAAASTRWTRTLPVNLKSSQDPGRGATWHPRDRPAGDGAPPSSGGPNWLAEAPARRGRERSSPRGLATSRAR